MTERAVAAWHGAGRNGATTFLFVLIAIFSVLASPVPAQDAYPSRQITLIVPFAPGGSTDAMARAVAEGLGKALGRAVVVDNQSGAGGSIGTAAIATAPPDGYTIGMGTVSTLAINPAVYENLPFDVMHDLVPIGKIAAVSNVMSINPSVPATGMAEFIALARSRPGEFSYASAGIGSVSHLLGEQFKLATSTEVAHVPYRGVGPALTDAVAGHVEAIFDNLPTSLPLILDGRLRPLAISGKTRNASLPDVPTFAELGLDEMNWMAFFGLVAPGGTPHVIVERLSEALATALAGPAVREALAAQQATIIGGSPEDFAAEIAREVERMRRAVAAADIRVE